MVTEAVARIYVYEVAALDTAFISNRPLLFGDFGTCFVPIRNPHAGVVEARRKVGLARRQVIKIVLQIAGYGFDQFDLQRSAPAERNLHMARAAAGVLLSRYLPRRS